MTEEQWQPERPVRVADGVDLCVQTCGDPGDPPVLLVGNTMLTWPDGFCAGLAAGGRFVVRYDLRDTGRSTLTDPDAPAYTLRDLVADAAGLLGTFGKGRGHVVGFGPGGWIGQLLALDHPERVRSLTLIATRPTAPGPNDDDLPEHAPEFMTYLMSTPEPDWADRAAVVTYMAETARRFAGGRGPFDRAAARSHAGRLYDRAAIAAPGGTDPRKIHPANQIAATFAVLDSGARWRERLGGITAPTLVVHGEDDPFFPLGNGRALADEIPGAELLILRATGQELPPRVWPTVLPALLAHTASG